MSADQILLLSIMNDVNQYLDLRTISNSIALCLKISISMTYSLLELYS